MHTLPGGWHLWAAAAPLPCRCRPTLLQAALCPCLRACCLLLVSATCLDEFGLSHACDICGVHGRQSVMAGNFTVRRCSKAPARALHPVCLPLPFCLVWEQICQILGLS